MDRNTLREILKLGENGDSYDLLIAMYSGESDMGFARSLLETARNNYSNVMTIIDYYGLDFKKLYIRPVWCALIDCNISLTTSTTLDVIRLIDYCVSEEHGVNERERVLFF